MNICEAFLKNDVFIVGTNSSVPTENRLEEVRKCNTRSSAFYNEKEIEQLNPRYCVQKGP